MSKIATVIVDGRKYIDVADFKADLTAKTLEIISHPSSNPERVVGAKVILKFYSDWLDTLI